VLVKSIETTPNYFTIIITIFFFFTILTKLDTALGVKIVALETEIS